jgi:hypothetical protein
MVLDKRRTGRRERRETGERERQIQYLVEQFKYASGERRIASRAKLELV